MGVFYEDMDMDSPDTGSPAMKMGVYDQEDMDMDSPDTEPAMKTAESPLPPVNRKTQIDNAINPTQVEMANTNGLEAEDPAKKKKKKKKTKKNKNVRHITL